MRLILIRHGESEHGLRGQIATLDACTGLTPRGMRQSRALADRLRAGGEVGDIDALLFSPALRAQQTADILASAWPSVTPEMEPHLCELWPGEAEGLTWEEYRARFGAFDLAAEPDRPFAPDGETWREFLARVRSSLDTFARFSREGTTIAVTHAGFIVAALLVLCDIPRPGPGARFEPTHAGLTELQYAAGVWQLVRYNDAAHLEGLAGGN